MISKIVVCAVFIIIGVVMFLYYKSTARPIKNIVVGSGTGVISLVTLGYIASSAISINLVTVAAAALLGIPGVIFMAILNFLYK